MKETKYAHHFEVKYTPNDGSCNRNMNKTFKSSTQF